MSICRYHKDSIINCVFKIIATLASLLFYKPNFTVLRQILTIIIIAEYGILAYNRNIFKIVKVWTLAKIWEIAVERSDLLNKQVLRYTLTYIFLANYNIRCCGGKLPDNLLIVQGMTLVLIGSVTVVWIAWCSRISDIILIHFLPNSHTYVLLQFIFTYVTQL